MPKMILLRGGPGSGKTHYAAQLTSSSPSYTVVSADHFFINDEGEYSFDPLWLGRAHGSCLRACVEAILRRENIIVDNTHSKSHEMIPYLALCQAFGYSCTVTKLRCDLDVAWGRQKHNVPRDKFDEIFARMDQSQVPKLYRGAPWLTIESERTDSREDTRCYRTALPLPRKYRSKEAPIVPEPYSGARCIKCSLIIVYSVGGRYCDHECDTCVCSDGAEKPSEPFAGAKKPRPARPDGLADCRACDGKVAFSKGCRMVESNLDSCACDDSFDAINFRKICNCGVSMGLRGDHESQCAATYLQRD